MDPAQQNNIPDPTFPAAPSTDTPATDPAINPISSNLPASPQIQDPNPTTPIIDSTPVSVPGYVQTTPTANDQNKRGGLKVFAFMFALLIFILLGSSAAAYLVATEKVPAPNPQIKSIASQLIFSLPFVPKTPGYVIDSFILNAKEYSSSSFDLSVAASSADFQSLVGGSNFDLRASGFADFSDKDKPLSDIKLEISNLFDAEIKQTSEKVYFKINKIPAFVYLFVGISPEQLEPVFQNWIAADVSTLDTQARQAIESSGNDPSPFDEATLTAFKKIYTEDIRPYLKLTTENLEGAKAYRLEFTPTPEQLDKIVQNISDTVNQTSENTTKTDTESDEEIKPSQMLTNVKFQVWIDQENHLRKISINSTYDPKSLENMYSDTPSINPSFSAPVDFAIVLSVSDFDQKFTISPPESSIPVEEFFSKINQLVTTQMSQETSTPSAYQPILPPSI